MRKANTIVRLQFADFPEFEASWIVKVTWENMTVFGDKSKVRSIFKIVLKIIRFIIKQINPNLILYTVYSYSLHICN